MPAHRVALHAALTSAAIKKALSSDGACIRVWIADEEDAVQALQIPPEAMIERQIGDWKLVTDRGLLDKLKLLRLTGLPAETGGVLLGTWDLTSRIVYIADTIPAPPDSKKRVTSFIRGCEGLLDKVAHAGRATSGMLQYVGEWHSHPNGFGTAPATMIARCLSGLPKKPPRTATSQSWPSSVNSKQDGSSIQLAFNRR